MTTTRPVSAPPTGLTSAQVEAARRRGDTNRTTARASRTYVRILRANLFTLFNNFLFVIGLTLLALGRTKDAVVSVGLGLVNSLIGSVQEVRAKRKLDRLKLLHRAPCRVMRDGVEQEVPAEDLVRGDLIRVAARDQIVVDGPVTGDGRLEVDESLLTGEPEPVVKHQGDQLLSGSVCVGGTGWQTAERVGGQSHAASVTSAARSWSVEPTPLQWRIDLVIRIVMLTVALMSAAILAQATLKGLPLVRVVQTAAVLSGLIPYGLFFLITVSYAVGAATIARRGALIQQINAVESLCNVDVLCTDKTGTLTTGRLSLEDVQVLDGADPGTVRRRLGEAARSMSGTGPTVAALVEALPGTRLAVRDEVPFSSARCWSAVSVEGARPAVHILGAAEALGEASADAAIGELTGRGLRVLVYATAEDPDADLHGRDGTPRLPSLHPVALVALRDELRPGVHETLRDLIDRGVAVKVISGDDPRTVAVLARRIGLDDAEPRTGAELEAMTPEAFGDAVATGVVFGRVAPRLKERMLDTLRQQGRYTAMIGDGVNDLPSLKKAHVGIAVESGSSVACDVADVVLLDDAFDALAPARHEGRRIVSGITTSMYLYLARVSVSILVIIGVAILGLGFPYEPAQVAIVLFTVGLPTLVLTAWAPPRAPDPGLLGSLGRFVVPSAVVTAVFGVALYATLFRFVQSGIMAHHVPPELVKRFEEFTGLVRSDATFADQVATVVAQTGLTVFTSLTAFALILFLEPPWRMFAGWTTVRADKRPAALVAALVAILLVILSVPALSRYFSLVPNPLIYIGVAVFLPPWFLALRTIWRRNLLRRVLGLKDPAGR
ncbi:HAD-IC family P-type ATPase [Dactylosporangium siamense]|uniref:Cation transporter E1-E2 family ATPase n=1 Tax=Dactylosporangium siamense TaxID=685454 RepID=A0A919PUD7_9ACTN|nr:HAD-IC family P-type ATPase [Dactylosporangium siamense]GIG48605.1 cation transporter E1-E2 family ATPase [Dactylosporangium siamense]